MKKLFAILLVCSFAFLTITFIGCGDGGAERREQQEKFNEARDNMDRAMDDYSEGQ